MTSYATSKPHFRFAPSPNGALHLGHAYSALLNHGLAKKTGGNFSIRVEDIDTTRCTPALEAAMFDDLTWLRLEWQKPVMQQSKRFAIYQQALDKLIERELIYPAFMSRGEIKKHARVEPNWPHDPDGAPLYPGLEKNWDKPTCTEAIASGTPFAWRLDMEKALTLFPIEGAKDWGDVVLARKDTPTSYHLSVVIDDAAQNISHVVRGLDLKAATPVHLLLQNLLSLRSPCYFHHRLVLDEEGAKLSKSNKATDLKHLRDEGATLDDILERIDWDESELETLYQSLIIQST
ncbi:MAG: tRNA glutamyl-Q(34) synthetase GluQRS [Hyphomicrobiales bacterium]